MSEEIKQDPADSLIASILFVKAMAKNVHYLITGNSFYTTHLLADKVSDFDDELDAFYEAYYLGLNKEQDSYLKYYALASQLTAKEDSHLKNLSYALGLVIANVELIKKEEGLPSGIHSALDSISQKALVMRGLVNHSI